MGLGVAPFETIVTAWVSDVYFVHERSTRNALWNLCLCLGSSLGGLVGGYIIEGLGWRYTFILCAITMAVCTPALILFVSESVYNREAIFETDIVALEGEPEDESTRNSKDEEEKMSKGDATETVHQRKTFVQQLKFCEGSLSDQSLLKLFLRPFKMAVYPSVIWAYLTYSAAVTWLALFATTQAQIFSQVSLTPPIPLRVYSPHDRRLTTCPPALLASPTSAALSPPSSATSQPAR